MNFKKFSRAQFSKLRNEINGVGEFRYDTTYMWPKFRINRITGLEIDRGDQNCTQTHTHTHTHTHTGCPFYKTFFFFFKKETRLKSKGLSIRNWEICFYNIDCLCCVVVSMSIIPEVPGSTSGYTIDIFLGI